MKSLEKNSLILSTSYDREVLETKIVHIGFGAFHRGHQAVYNDLTNDASEDKWGIFELNLFGPSDLVNQLREQDYLFTVTEKSAQESQSRLVRTLTGALHTPDSGIEAAIEKMVEPQVAIVSLTITEKGYCVNPQLRVLDLANPLIQRDIETPQQPASAIGLIVEALRRRKELGLTPFSVMSCDNIPENGHLTQAAVLSLAEQTNSELAAWIAAKVTFPNTMVDRIVPAMTAENFEEVEAALGRQDPCGVICESFRQWVVEDNFVAGRPRWEKVGAMLVKDVLPYEEMKLRMLNGSHSFLAYNGSQAGYTYIYECMQDANLKAVTRRLMLEEQARSLSPDLDVNLPDYAELLLERFSNTAIKHKTMQIAMDGSQKLPQRAIDPMLHLFNKGIELRCLPVLIAGWMHSCRSLTHAGEVIQDPLGEQIANLIRTSQSESECFQNLMSIEKIFPAALHENQSLVGKIWSAYSHIEEAGIHAVIESLAK